jgi:hypothetical protein
MNAAAEPRTQEGVAGVSDDLRANLDHLLPKCGQRPAFDLVRQNQSTEDGGHVVGRCWSRRTRDIRHLRRPMPLGS